MDKPLIPATGYPAAELEAAAEALAALFGHPFRVLETLGVALTHKSIKGADNNERLEHLGDAVLETALTDILYAIQPPLSEGQLGSIRGNLVHNRSLARLGANLGLLNYARIAPSVPSVVREGKILADLVEAVFGAIYLEGGIPAVKPVCVKLFAEELDLARRNPNAAGRPTAKTRLQAIVQQRHIPTPVYAVTRYREDPTNPYFRIRATIAGGVYSTEGEGRTRLAAEEQAAEHMIATLARRKEVA